MTASSDTPSGIRACWMSWIAVRTTRQTEVVKHLGLTDIHATTWSEGVESVETDAHDRHRRSSTVVTPAVQGWTLAFGFWCSLPRLENVAPITGLCQQLSLRFGDAHAYFSSEQGDGEAWLIAHNGVVIRRFISEYPELALGEPFGAERRHLDAAGITGRPEDLDPDSDQACDWLTGTYLFTATEIAAEASLDPTGITEHTPISGLMLLAHAPAIDHQGPTAQTGA